MISIPHREMRSYDNKRPKMISVLNDMAMSVHRNDTSPSNATVEKVPTNSIISEPKWDFMAGFYITAIILTLPTNGTVLSAFFSRRSLRTPFNIYLMNLLSANILNATLQNIPDLLNHLYPAFRLGDTYCSALVFSLYLFNAGVQNCHILIAVNRIWAVFWPYSYRHSHTKRVALVMCLAGWVEVSVLVLPSLVLDTMYYRTDTANGCNFNIAAQWGWSTVLQFLVYNMGLYVMWIAYPLIWYKRRQSLKVVLSPAPATPATTRSHLLGLRQLRSLEDADSENTSNEGHRPLAASLSSQKRSSKAFTVLTVMTISVTICWTPIHTFYTLLLWLPFDRIGQLALDIGVILCSLQSFIDPILLVCTLPDLRESLRRTINKQA
ncbi:hypothetical protein BV898_05588 [Hypsibius exemplaris]|uniref:G-protein coupled receptors family 1 profile domain-containing protein n=1 Tax=Hypsibius exemplaris TaxID=2072580 RepID=A0A1W0WZB2_HYPEX|nr:hypothetical protein BV898_05588 [Hypsibius exemplaris]